jgi:hypothetical protein
MKPLTETDHPEHCYYWTDLEIEFINKRVRDAVHEYESKSNPSIASIATEVETLRDQLAELQGKYLGELMRNRIQIEYISASDKIRATFEKDEEDNAKNLYNRVTPADFGVPEKYCERAEYYSNIRNAQLLSEIDRLKNLDSLKTIDLEQKVEALKAHNERALVKLVQLTEELNLY